MMWGWTLTFSLAFAWPEKGPEGVETGRTVDSAQLFSEGAFPADRVITEPAEIGAMCRSMLEYLRNQPDPWATPGMLAEQGVTAEQIRATLEKVAVTAETSPEKLSDPTFLAENFRYLRWSPDQTTAGKRGITLAPGEARLTKYVIYRQSGSSVRTATHTHALYAVPADEAGMTEAEATEKRGELTRFRYTRPEIFAGALEGSAQPLVWLSQEGVIQAMLQGTVEVTLADGSPHWFNVHRHNGIPYDRAEKDGTKQARYWYFREVPGPLGWGSDPDHKVQVHPGVVVAGDVYNFGLGILFLLETAPGEARLAILADTGGAFQPNLYQLDYLAGTFDSEAEMYRQTKDVPDRVRGGVLIVR